MGLNDCLKWKMRWEDWGFMQSEMWDFGARVIAWCGRFDGEIMIIWNLETAYKQNGFDVDRRNGKIRWRRRVCLWPHIWRRYFFGLNLEAWVMGNCCEF